SFIPNKIAKNGKRFGFVRFINVFDVQRLVGNLETVWIDRHKLQANIARFQRSKANSSHSEGKTLGGDVESKSQAAMVLDDECLISRDLSKALMCRVKVFAYLTNLRVTLKNEVDFQLPKRIAWVEVEGVPFKLWSSKTFCHIANKWGDLLDVDDEDDNCFHSKWLCIHTKMDRSISEEFKIIHRGFTYWVRANEVPGWVPDFNDDFDEEDQDDNNGYDDEVKMREPDVFGDENDDDRIPETLPQDDVQDAKNMEEGEIPLNVEQSEDPFNIYPLINKNDEKDMNENDSKRSLKYPPVFSPKENQDENSFNGGGECHDMGNDTGMNDNFLNCKIKKQVYEGSNVLLSSGHFKLPERPCTGGSILDLLKEVVKENVTVSDSLVILYGTWRPTGQKYLLIAMYAPHDAREKNMLWDYLHHVIVRWKGEVVIIRDFNKTSLNKFPNISAVSLDRLMSDHRPILLREVYVDYGPIPFKCLHYRFDIDGFNKIVEDGWNEYNGKEGNKMRHLIPKFKHLKSRIREWYAASNVCNKKESYQCKCDREAIDAIIDSGNGEDEDVCKRTDIINKLYKIGELKSKELAQKAKIKWAIEGDENSRFFHDDPKKVKKQFLNHFSDRLCKPGNKTASIDMDFPKKISDDQVRDLEREVTNEDIKRAVWDCGTDKAPGPDGFTFGFLRRLCLIGSLYKIIAKILANRLTGVLDGIVNEVQSAFVADRQILDGPFILNEVIQWCKTKKKQALIFKVSGLRINMSKSKILGVHVDSTMVHRAAMKLGCLILKTPFMYLGTILGGNMSRIDSWDVVMDKVKKRLSKWKMNTLSVGGRLTLVKSVLGSMPLYHLSLFKAPSGVLNRIEALRNRFFNGLDSSCKRAIWNLWARVIQAIHGVNGKIGTTLSGRYKSCWLVIVHEINVLMNKGINVMQYLRRKVGNREDTKFWEDKWCDGGKLKDRFHRLYALEANKQMTVGRKMAQITLSSSFRRNPRSGIEMEQFANMVNLVKETYLNSSADRWLWELEKSGEFLVSSTRNLIDEKTLHGADLQTRWNNWIPIKVNVLTWKLMTNSLPTQFKISCRGILIDSILCVNCDKGVETRSHLFFSCPIARQVVKENQEKDKNRIKTRQKREACRSWEKFKAVALERGRKTKENKKRMAENAYTYQKLFQFKEKKKREGPLMQLLESSNTRTNSAYLFKVVVPGTSHEI
nr:RNA-directed DNA polymerase, eukaryota [Tanacetum cinerariifolium]